MRSGRLLRTILSITLALLIGPSVPLRHPALAQNAPPASSAPTLKVYSRETVFDVTVTDDKGVPVHGLTRDDFTIKEDNKLQPIRSFHEYSSEPASPASKLPPNVYTNRQPPPSSGAVNLLLLDFINSAPIRSNSCCLGDAGVGPEELHLAMRAQHLIKQEAMKYVAAMPPGTKVSVLGFSNSLRILQGFTSDPELLRAAIDTMQYNSDGRADNFEEGCAQEAMRNRMTLEVFNQIAADVSAIKGRKNLIWFSVPVPSLIDPSSRLKCLPDYETELPKTYGLLAAAQIALYPVDGRGIPPVPSFDNVADFYMRVAVEQLAMDAWAEKTGGQAFYNSNDIAGSISKAIDSGAEYYTISYVPPGQKYDWGHHNIKVAVDKPGLNLVYRKTYDAVDPVTIKPTLGLTLASTPSAVVAGNMKAAMSRSMPTSTDILFDVQVEPSTVPRNPTDPPGTILGILDPAVKAKLKGKLPVRYAFSYSMAASQLTFTPAPDNSHKGLVELDIAAFDTEDKLVTSLSQTVTMPLTDERYKKFVQGPFNFIQQLDLPPGQLFLRIGVLDRTSNKVGTLEIPLTVAAH